MDAKIREKIQSLITKLESIEQELGNPEATQDQAKYAELTREYSRLRQIADSYDRVCELEKDIHEYQSILKDESDAELISMAEEELPSLEEELNEKLPILVAMLVPPGPYDHCNTIIELRAGTGGEEAALFVADCVRMYRLFADEQGWNCERLSAAESDQGGFKEFVMVITGENVYRFMQYEAGTHRVQRVPDTETQGRVHTSAITVAVLLEPDNSIDVDIQDKDLRIDTFRASGAGGQHVNTTDSAVRITHMPTGTVAVCQDERSQHKNKDKAMRILKARIMEKIAKEKQDKIDSERAGQIGSGDRSERIRTYNFNQNRLTDHRINFTRYNLDHVMEGELKEVMEALISHYAQQKLESLE